MLEYIGDIFHHFFDPKKRVFLGYVVLSIAIALLWLVFLKKKGLKSAIFKVFDKKILLSGSAISDYKMFLINRVLMMVLAPYLLSQLAVATFLYYSLLSLPIGGFLSSLNEVPPVIVVATYSLSFSSLLTILQNTGYTDGCISGLYCGHFIKFIIQLRL